MFTPVTKERVLCFSITMVAFLLTTFAIECNADCSCSLGGNGIEVVGVEFMSENCPADTSYEDNDYYYIVNSVDCNGSSIYRYTSFGDAGGTPKEIINSYTSRGYKVMRNKTGTHLIFIQNDKYPFTGTIIGKSIPDIPVVTEEDSPYKGTYVFTTDKLNKFCTEEPAKDIDKNQNGIPDCLENNPSLPANQGCPQCP